MLACSFLLVFFFFKQKTAYERRISDWRSDVCASDLVHRLYAVLDKELGERPYLASDDYSIADIATYPWIARFPLHGLEWAAVPNVKRWFDAVGARPAVASGMAVPSA